MIFDHGTIVEEAEDMEEIAISKFKATCLAVLERVRKTRRPVLVTRFGQPVAEVVPPQIPPRPEGWLGSMRDTGRVVGDIVAPVVAEADWEAEA
jgi:prevent-host-death family protein